MRTLNRNKKTLYYALYDKVTPYIDENGDKTGEYGPSYSAPVKTRMNIAPARGDSEEEMFGITEPYTHVIVTSNTKCPIEETSVLWIGTDLDEESLEGSTGIPDGSEMVWSKDGNEIRTPAFNYVVIRKAPSINSISYAIKKVVNDAE